MEDPGGRAKRTAHRQGTSDDVYYMGLCGVLFRLSDAAFRPERLLFSKPILLIVLPVVNGVGVLVEMEDGQQDCVFEFAEVDGCHVCIAG